MNKLNYNRRTFLKLAGMSAAALTIPGMNIARSFKYRADIGLQLYTVRKAIESDFVNTIMKIADIGYLGIETYNLPENITLGHASKVFKEAGLEIFSMHSDLPVGKQFDAALRMADAYKCDTIIYHGWPHGEKYKDSKALEHSVELYNEISIKLKSRGLRFGLHNHWWEFEPVGSTTPFYYLLENLNKDIIFEIDTYWAKTAGADPVKIVRDFGERAPLLHIKDGNAIKGKKSYDQVPIGEGVMNFPSIINAGGENIKWLIVEFDEYNKSIFEGINKSYNYLVKNGLGKGKV